MIFWPSAIQPKKFIPNPNASTNKKTVRSDEFFQKKKLLPVVRAAFQLLYLDQLEVFIGKLIFGKLITGGNLPRKP
jgi:hypothetical protein